MAALPDSGFFMDWPNVDGVYAYRQSFQAAVGPALWNGAAGTNAACIAALAPADQWQCWFAQYVYPYVVASGVPFFIAQSMVDQWSVSEWQGG
jgi:hypothetical protein